ncbi:MAG: ribosomal protein S18-alanine N-acetyltransferase [Deltaproteobacteria bacterium]|nr:ribosomal protein S18-alanine N-acetyltransferase [Deltaproteobacteria bacterium]
MTTGPSSSIVVRNAARFDADAMSALEKAVFSDPWTYNMLENALARPETIALCGVSESELYGSIVLRTAADEAEVMRIAVAAGHRRGGLGSLLLEKGLALAKNRCAVTAFLEVRETNRAAVSFYEAHSFELTGKRPRYYSDTGEAALVMARIL